MPAVSQSFRCFDEVARRGSIRRASETLNLTAAAVNQQILNLEQIVGTPLFDRVPRGMALTSAGEIMLAAIRRGQRDFDNALSQVEDLRALRRGHVNIGVSQSSAEYTLPDIIESVMDQHPGLTFSIHSGTGEQLLKWVATAEVDVAYCLRRPPPPGVEEVRAWPQHLGVVTAPNHPLALSKKRLRMRDCLEWPLVQMTQYMDMRTLADRIEPKLLQSRRQVLETSSVAMVRRLVSRGEFIAFMLPDNVVQDVEAGNLEWIGLDDPGARLHSCLFQRTGYSTPVAMATFLSALEEAVSAVQQSFEERYKNRVAASERKKNSDTPAKTIRYS